MSSRNLHYPHLPAIIPSVGNRIIDTNHKQLFDIIHRVQQSIITGNLAAMSAEFEVFENFARTCFSAEEEIARAAGFDFTWHGMAHQNLLEKYRQIKDELIDRKVSWSETECEAYLMMLVDLLKRHLDHESRSLMCVLDTYYYDFRPDQGQGNTE